MPEERGSSLSEHELRHSTRPENTDRLEADVMQQRLRAQATQRVLDAARVNLEQSTREFNDLLEKYATV